MGHKKGREKKGTYSKKKRPKITGTGGGVDLREKEKGTVSQHRKTL